MRRCCRSLPYVVSSLKSLSKSPGKLIAALIVLALGITAWGIYLALRPAGNSSRNTPAAANSAPANQVQGTISALGRLEPEGTVIRIAAPSALGSSRVSQLLVKEGGPVKEGQVIAVMDVRERLLAAAMQAEAQVIEAQRKLDQARSAGATPSQVEAQLRLVDAKREEAERRNLEVQDAQRELDRYTKLYKDGAISGSEVDRRSLTLQTAKRALNQAVKELEQAGELGQSLTEVRGVDVRRAEAELQVALANLERAKADLNTSIVRSPITGQVIKIHAYPGEQVGQDGIAELGRTNQMFAVAEVYETDIAKVRPGQRARITSPAFNGPISGVVDQVGLEIRKNDVLNTDPAEDTDTRVVEVKIRLDNSRPIAGMTNLQVRVEILP